MSYNLLKGEKGIIFGALDEKSLAWKVAMKAFEEGAVFTLTNTPIALRFGELKKLAERCGSEIIPADATRISELETVFSRSIEVLGGKVDFVLHSIARSFGYIYGREKHIRVNTISQSLTMTTAGSGVKGIDALLDFTERMSPLGNATAEECADFCIVLFSDLSRKITMQNIYHDGGFSSMGMSLKAMTQYNKCLDEDE
ncbi:MAG: SDR family oxidoreductase [bacterium]